MTPLLEGHSLSLWSSRKSPSISKRELFTGTHRRAWDCGCQEGGFVKCCPRYWELAHQLQEGGGASFCYSHKSSQGLEQGLAQIAAAQDILA